MKNWALFALCLAFSAGIWLIHRLTQDFEDTVSVLVIAESNIDGRAHRSSSEETVTVRVAATGFRLLSFSRSSDTPVVVEFRSDDLVPSGSGTYRVSNSILYKYSEQIFGPDAEIESILSPDLEFRFAEENCIKVPVHAVQTLDFAPEYIALREARLIPDSVMVYGEPERLAHISDISTRPIVHRYISNSVHGSVMLDVPDGLRVSQDEVVYNIDVTRYVELDADVPVQTRNVPPGVHLAALPATVHVTLRCVFPLDSDPLADAVFYVDYDDFEDSITGRCVVRCDYDGGELLSYEVSPQICDCILTR